MILPHVQTILLVYRRFPKGERKALWSCPQARKIHDFKEISLSSESDQGFPLALDLRPHFFLDLLNTASYFGEHVRNISNKKDTFTVEGVNADLRHYIPVLARRSRCFARKLETLQAVMEVFVDAYNKFGEAKTRFRQNRDPKSRELPFSVLDFL